MLRKRDELKFPKLFAHIRLRRQQGLLIFLSSQTPDVEKYLKDKIKKEFSGQFPIREIPFNAGDYVPLQVIAAAEDFSPDILYIIGEFPYEAYYKNPALMEDKLVRLTTSLNIGRELFSSRDLKCVFICPAEVEDRIALKAADFYHFTHYSASFTDDAKFHRDIEGIERGGHEKQKRIDFLLEILKETETRKREERADIYLDLGIHYYELSDIDRSLHYWQKALKIYRKSKNEKKLSTALGNIGMVYRNLGQAEEALKYLKQALAIHRKVGYLQGEASDLGNIGLVYRNLGQAEEALKYHKQALAIDRKIGYLQGEANQLGNIGLVYSDLGQSEEALKYLKNSRQIYRQINLPVPQTVTNTINQLTTRKKQKGFLS